MDTPGDLRNSSVNVPARKMDDIQRQMLGYSEGSSTVTPRPMRAEESGRPETADTGLRACTFLGSGGTGGKPRFQEGLRTCPLATLFAIIEGFSGYESAVDTAVIVVAG